MKRMDSLEGQRHQYTSVWTVLAYLTVIMEAGPSCLSRFNEEFRRKTKEILNFLKEKNTGERFLAGGLCLFFWGLCTNYWGSAGVIHYGLWYYCNRKCSTYSEVFVHEWIMLTKVMEEIASLTYCTAVFILVRRMYWKATYSLQKVAAAPGVSLIDILILTAGVLSLTGSYIFFINTCFPHSVSWSWVAVVLGSLSVTGGFVCCRNQQCLRRKGSSRRIKNTQNENAVMNA